jgi:hypothetical protein
MMFSGQYNPAEKRRNIPMNGMASHLLVAQPIQFVKSNGAPESVLAVELKGRCT